MPSSRIMQPVPTRSAVTRDVFEGEVRPAGRPVILKGQIAHWPIVAAARAGNVAVAAAIAANADPRPVPVAHAPHEAGGRFHYRGDWSGFTFDRTPMPLADFMELLLAERVNPAPRALATQGLLLDEVLPHFSAVHSLDLLPRSVAGRMWICNRSSVATHGDDLENLACMAAGRRRFTLFPPDQIGNLYMGPFQPTPGGTPISMVHVTAPDTDRYPRFATALDSAWEAVLEPGDALYLPYQWYHHVEGLDAINVLVNYWWDDSRPDIGSRWDALLHAMITMRSLPEDQRAAWKTLFDHYAFITNGDPGAHLPEAVRGILGPHDRKALAQYQADLRANLDPASTQKVGPLK